MPLSFGTRLLAVVSLGLFSTVLLAAEAPSNAELQRQIEELKQQIRVLNEKLSQPRAAGSAPALDDKVQAQEKKIQEQQTQIEALAKQAEETKKADWVSRTKVGGYGELHYNNLEGKDESKDDKSKDKDEIDFHRFVLLFGHDFNDWIRLRSELEIEHALIKDTDGGTSSTTTKGEVEIEQAYVEFDIDSDLSAKAGLFLIPVGILNETHEPPTFYGVERNPVENAIIPTTWWAGGAGATWRFAEGWTLDAAIHEGLKTSAGGKFAVRSGRQKTSEAKAEDLASTLRVKWTGLPGLELAASYQFQKDIDQSKTSIADDANLFETHAIYQNGPFGLRALYAAWHLDGEGSAAADDPKDFGADKQDGFYLEPSWRLSPEWGAFLRYSVWDNQAGKGALLANDPGDTEKKHYNLGFNFWPHQNVVLKADYQMQDNEDEKNQDGINLGVGYQF